MKKKIDLVQVDEYNGLHIWVTDEEVKIRLNIHKWHIDIDEDDPDHIHIYKPQ